MNQTRMLLRLLLLMTIIGGLLTAFPAAAAPVQSDSITVDSVTGSGTVDVPVYIRDAAGSPLGIDQLPGSRIQAFSIRVVYSPASSVQSISFSRAGITSSLTPSFESSPSSANAISLLDSFSETTNLIPFTSNGGAPGDQVAHLSVTLSPSAAPGSTVTLAIDSTLTQLTDDGGSSATKESVGNGNLMLVDGQITVSSLTVSLSPSSMAIGLGGTGTLTVILSGTSPNPTTVNLLSLSSDVASVPSSVVIPAGSTSGSFTVTAVSAGTARIRATLGSSTATSDITVSAPPPDCPQPATPVISVPASIQAGTPYNVTWTAVANATEYILDEATDQAFATKTSQTLTVRTATFTHPNGGTRYYYRVRARNHASGCDVYSGYSTAGSVLITAIPVPEKRYFAVVGSLPGGFGSYFRTSVQLYNSHDSAISGVIVFHPANASGAAGDPSMPYSVGAGKTLAYSDLLPAMGVASGLGSVDIIGDIGSPAPVALERVFNDGGASGTTGFAAEALSVDGALTPGAKGVLLAPADAQHFRLNIGVRTLTNGATLLFTVRDKDGAVVKSATKTYGATYFAQTESSVLLDGYALTGGETVTIEVTAGSAFVYGSTTDNTTNDPSVQLARSAE